MQITTPLIQIIVGSTRDERRGEPIARWLADLAAVRGDLTVELVDLGRLRLPFLTHATPPINAHARDGAALDWSRQVAAADGYIVVTPEYNHGYPAPLKNALDHLFSEWNRKPMAFVSYGASGGGIRAVEQLRQVAIELEMVPIRRQVAIPRVWAAIDDHGRLRQPPAEEATVLLDDLIWWATTLRAGRALPQAA
jgi:NAD(P)H-dependent FMN reductase